MKPRYRHTPTPECATCQAVGLLAGRGVTEIVAVGLQLRRPPEVVAKHLHDHNRADLLGLLTDRGQPLPNPDGKFIDVHCPDCGDLLEANVGRSTPKETIAGLHAAHTCKQPTTPRKGHSMTASPQPAARPPVKDLTNHPDSRIARQARKVLAENDKLTALWREDQGKAELRAEIAALEAELKAKRQLLRTGQKAGHPAPAGVPALPAKQIREWAAGQGILCPVTGKLPSSVVEAFKQAQQVAS